MISFFSGQPGTVRAMRTATLAVGRRVDRADHAEVDDRAVQLGILDGTQGVDDLVARDGHRGPLAVRVPRRRANLHYGHR